MKLFRQIKRLLCTHYFWQSWETFKNNLVIRYALECELCGHIEEQVVANMEPLNNLIAEYCKNNFD